MGFFSNLFSKKTCSVCGKEMGMLERKELKDGNICNACADKLSPWFEERKESTLEQIKEQLKYRENNLIAVKEFTPTRTIGRSVKVCIDEKSRHFFVSQESDLFKENPDIIAIPLITNISLDTQKNEHELYDRDSEGHMVSYNPRRYDYSFEFYVDIYTNHPYAKHLRFKLNDSSVWVRYNQFGAGAFQQGNASGMAGVLGAIVQGVGNAMAGQNGMVGTIAGMSAFGPEYQQYVNMGEEIRNTLMRLRSNTPGGQPLGMAQTQVFTFDSMNNPIGGQRLFAYKLMTPINGINIVNLFLNVTFEYQVFNPQQFNIFGGKMMQMAVLGLSEILQQGLPITPEQLPQNEGLLSASFASTNGAKELQSCGVNIMRVRVNNVMFENGQVANMAQQTVQNQPAGAGKWFCPNCGAPNVGKFCESCGTQRNV